MIDAEGNTSMPIPIYDDKERMLKQEQSGWLREKLGKIAPLMDEQPSIEYLEVATNQ